MSTEKFKRRVIKVLNKWMTDPDAFGDDELLNESQELIFEASAVSDGQKEEKEV